MIKTVYIDVLFTINFIINYLLLLATARFSDVLIKRFRIALGALVGAIYGIVVFFPGLTRASCVILKIFVALIMILFTFGWKSNVKYIRLTLVFYGLSFAFAGTVLALYYVTNGAWGLFGTNNLVFYINIPFWTLICSVLFGYILFTLIFKPSMRCAKREIRLIEVKNKTKAVGFRALVDTGNSLRDPFTNAQVIVTEYKTVRDIVPYRVRAILDKQSADSFPLVYEKIPFEYNFKLIPYKTINRGFNLLLAFKPENIMVDGSVSTDALIAFSPTEVSDGGMYAALI